MNNQGYRLVRINGDILTEMLRYDGIGGKQTFTADGLPKDAELVDIDTSDFCERGRLTFKFRSSEWPPIPSGELIPVLSIDVRAYCFAHPLPTYQPQITVGGISR